MEFSWNFLNSCRLGRTDQCWQSRVCASVLNVMSSTSFRPGHLPDPLLVFQAEIFSLQSSSNIPWSCLSFVSFSVELYVEGRNPRGSLAVCGGSSVLLPCCVSCLSSFLAVQFQRDCQEAAGAPGWQPGSGHGPGTALQMPLACGNAGEALPLCKAS